MKKFTIIGILAAADCFIKKEGANVLLEESLRDIESQKQSIAPQQVVYVDSESICDAFVPLVFAACHSKLVISVVMKYVELGHVPVD